MTRYDVLRRYPRLVAHMMCESLGYFSANTAAAALKDFMENQPCYCEWYYSMVRKNNSLLDIGRKMVQQAIRGRHNHKGYMASYDYARALVQREIEHLEPVTPFGGWM